MLPSLDQVPDLAPFRIPFKNQAKVTNTILEMNNTFGVGYMRDSAHAEWEGFFKDKVPKTPDPNGIDPSKRPCWKLREQPSDEPTPEQIEVQNIPYCPATRSVLDVMNQPIINPITHPSYTTNQRNRQVAAVVEGSPVSLLFVLKSVTFPDNFIPSF